MWYIQSEGGMLMSNYNAKRSNDYLKNDKKNKRRSSRVFFSKKEHTHSQLGHKSDSRTVITDHGTEGTPPKQGK